VKTLKFVTEFKA